MDEKEFERVKGIIKEHWDDDRNMQRLIGKHIDLQEISYEQIIELLDIIDTRIGFYLAIPAFMNIITMTQESH